VVGPTRWRSSPQFDFGQVGVTRAIEPRSLQGVIIAAEETAISGRTKLTELHTKLACVVGQLKDGTAILRTEAEELFGNCYYKFGASTGSCAFSY
jgi:hypothetical protein